MGKPQVDQLGGKNSNHSMKTNTSKEKMNVPMSLKKIANKKRRKHSKTHKNIKKLFDKLRSDSNTSLSTSDTTVIELDVSEDQEAGKKRKLTETSIDLISKRRKNRSDSLIVIPDDHDLVINNDPCCGSTSTTPKKPTTIQCSTPIINKDSKVLQDLIISNFPSSKNNNSNVAQNLNSEVADLTKEINHDSFLTIDLTTETLNCSVSKTQNTVIDLVNSTADNGDCALVSFSNTNLSMSGESDVTVINLKDNKKENEMRKFASGIAKLDASEKGRLLELITQNIFSGCNMPVRKRGSQKTIKESQSQATETMEDTYIKEVIVGQTNSRNSIGSNIYNPERDIKNKTGLRMIVIDGSNVAMEHGRGKIFSVKGLKICIDYFLKRGHVVKAFVPRFRCKFGKSSDPRLLDDLERRGLVVYTPSREIQGRTVTAYDDRYIVQCAAEFDGIIVSGDNYRDLLRENPRWRFVIENRLLQFTWVDDMIMFPRDPLGRRGPTLEDFLRHPSQPNPVIKI